MNKQLKIIEDKMKNIKIQKSQERQKILTTQIPLVKPPLSMGPKDFTFSSKLEDEFINSLTKKLQNFNLKDKQIQVINQNENQDEDYSDSDIHELENQFTT